jgi:hypothetical protein
MMKKINRCDPFTWVFLMSVLMVLPSTVFCEEYKSTIDYIQKTNKLWGISACTVNKDGSMTLVDRKEKGYGYALWIPDGKGGFLEEVTLKPGKSCELIDGDHAFITYKFIGFKDGWIIIEVTDKFDARSFGGEAKQERKALMIIPYEDNQ